MLKPIVLVAIFTSLLSSKPLTINANNLLTVKIAAPATAEKCWPLDIVMLVDQSGSMFARTPYNVPDEQRFPPSDPKAFRYLAARDVLNQLATNRQEICQDAVHRFGMVAFAGAAKTYLPLSRVDLSSSDKRDIWLSDYKRAITQAERDFSLGGYTDFIIGYNEAKKVFENAPAIDDSKASYGARHKLVILVTDGSPSTEKIADGSYSAYMCSLVSALNGNDWRGIKKYVVSINASTPYLEKEGCNGTLRANWRELTEKTGGKLFDRFPYNEQLIPQTINNIVRDEFGVKGDPIVCNEPFFVEPYLKSIELNFYSQEGHITGGVVIEKVPDAIFTKPYTVTATSETPDLSSFKGMKMTKYDTSEARETFKIVLPRPGTWRFTVPGLTASECQRRYTADKSRFEAKVQLVQPAALDVLPVTLQSPYYDIDQPTSLSYRLTADLDGKDIPFAEEPEYKLVVTATLRLPSRNTALSNGSVLKTYELTPDKDGLWTSKSTPIITPEEGEYVINSVASTISPSDRKTRLVVFEQTDAFRARKLQRLSFVVESPIANAPLPCNEFNPKDKQLVNLPVDVRVRVFDEAKQPIDAQSLLRPDDRKANPAVMRAQFVDATNNSRDAIALTPSTEKGVFTGKLLVNQRDPLGCDRVGVPEAAAVKVLFDGLIADPTQYALANKQSEVRITRVRAEGVLNTLRQPTAGSILPINKGFCADFFNGKEGITPVRAELRLTDLKGGLIDPTTVTNGDISKLYQARLIGPNGSNQNEDLILTLERTADGPVLAATGGLSVTLPGDYAVEIIPRPGAFKPEYRPSTETTTVKLTRGNDLLSSPTTCTATLGGSGFTLAGLLAALISAIVLTPRGTITFRDTDTGSTLFQKSITPSWMGIFKAKDTTLEKAGFSRIEVSKASKADMDSGDVGEDGVVTKTGKAIKLKLYDSDKTLSGEPVLRNGADPYDAGSNIEITYR